VRALITQFDSGKSRRKNSVVMYSGCCSCCCCCCVVTAIGSSIILARRLGLSLTEQRELGGLKMEEKSFQGRVRSAKILGFFIFPLSVLVALIGLFSLPGFTLLVPPICAVSLYAFGLVYLHAQYGLPKRYMIQYFFLTVLLFTGEFFIWLHAF